MFIDQKKLKSSKIVKALQDMKIMDPDPESENEEQV